MNYVIIGNGVAGIHAAETIRQFDPNGKITMISDEVFPPYCRPMISMVLEGVVPPEKLPIRSSSFYEELKIEPVLGKRVSAVNLDNRAVSVNGKVYPYDKLLIATGADPRRIKADGLELKNIFFMRTETHVRQMLVALPTVRKALVLGGGLVGFKASYGLLRRGIEVTMLIRSGYPLSMQVDPEAGRMIWNELKAHGLDVRLGVEATAFEGKDTVTKAHLSDGTLLSCDMVVIGKGVFPACGFIPKDKIKVDAGIVVDEHMETSAPGVFAAGDVAESIDIARKTPWVNAIWPEAVAQGRIAGINMAGRRTAYKGSLSRNVIRIFGMDVMTAGLITPPEAEGFDILNARDSRAKTYRKLVFRGDRLVGMVMVNGIEQGGLLMSLIQSETPVRAPREALLKSGFNFKQLMQV
ncbi:MAG TPA: NAD(P)/FAD-dependent oxidoreductase [Syntrophobacteraceae bacterium]|nr:NAD(P)/FAD-dependent oxidoreductase [Syntrophobacteraceae bacterium]